MQASTKLSLAAIAAVAVTAPVGIALAADPGASLQDRPAALAAPLAGHRSVNGQMHRAAANIHRRAHRRAAGSTSRRSSGASPSASRTATPARSAAAAPTEACFSSPRTPGTASAGTEIRRRPRWPSRSGAPRCCSRARAPASGRSAASSRRHILCRVDIARLRDEFAVLRRHAYLNAGSDGPVPAAALIAARAELERQAPTGASSPTSSAAAS